MHYRQPLFPLVVGLTLIVVGLGIAAVQRKPVPVKPAPVVTRAVRFDSCGDTAGILVIRSDGSSAWHRPPFQGLRELLAHLPSSELYAVTHCPSLPEATSSGTL